MDMKTIEENGKVYLLDEETGLVVEAKDAEQKTASVKETIELALNERVEVDGRPGKVVSRIASIYGMVLGIRFDDGSFDERLEDEVTASTQEAMRFDTPIDQVKADWEKYQEMPAFTEEQLDAKARLARSLNITAKALVTDKRTSLSDQVILDGVVVVTGTDLIDIKEQIERVTVGDSYVTSMPQYAYPNEVAASSEFSRSDASWLSLSADEAENDTNDFNWDSHLSNEALKATSRLEDEQLKSDDFMDAVADFREAAMPVGFNAEHRDKFRALLTEARKDALTERASAKLSRVAAVKEELADFNDAQLYL